MGPSHLQLPSREGSSFLPDHSLSPDSSRRQSGLMILFTAWESSLKRNLAAAGKADRKKLLEGISCVSSCLHQPLFSTLECQHSQQKARSKEQGTVWECPAGGGGCEGTPVCHQPLTSPQRDIPMHACPAGKEKLPCSSLDTRGWLCPSSWCLWALWVGWHWREPLGSPKGQSKGIREAAGKEKC